MYREYKTLRIIKLHIHMTPKERFIGKPRSMTERRH